MIIWSSIALIACGLAIYIFEIRPYQAYKKVTTKQRGNKSERHLVYKLVKNNFHHKAIFHDLYLNTSANKYAQIDIVVATKVGLIVIEVKDYSGWLFGKGHQEKWTQILNYGKAKYRFYNPILQNKNHIEHLKRKLPKENIPIFSVVVFYGNCMLKDIDYIPKNTFLATSNKAIYLIKKIIKENEPATYKNKHEIVRVLKAAVNNGDSKDIQQQHVQNIKEKLGKHRIYKW